jgi:hypothetical protein
VLSVWRQRNGTEHREAVMAPEPDELERQRTVGLPHDALVRVDRRVSKILARRQAALQQTELSLSLERALSASGVARAAVRFASRTH